MSRLVWVFRLGAQVILLVSSCCGSFQDYHSRGYIVLPDKPTNHVSYLTHKSAIWNDIRPQNLHIRLAFWLSSSWGYICNPGMHLDVWSPVLLHKAEGLCNTKINICMDNVIGSVNGGIISEAWYTCTYTYIHIEKKKISIIFFFCLESLQKKQNKQKKKKKKTFIVAWPYWRF